DRPPAPRPVRRPRQRAHRRLSRRTLPPDRGRPTGPPDRPRRSAHALAAAPPCTARHHAAPCRGPAANPWRVAPRPLLAGPPDREPPAPVGSVAIPSRAVRRRRAGTARPWPGRGGPVTPRPARPARGAARPGDGGARAAPAGRTPAS